MPVPPAAAVRATAATYALKTQCHRRCCSLHALCRRRWLSDGRPLPLRHRGPVPAVASARFAALHTHKQYQPAGFQRQPQSHRPNRSAAVSAFEFPKIAASVPDHRPGCHRSAPPCPHAPPIHRTGESAGFPPEPVAPYAVAHRPPDCESAQKSADFHVPLRVRPTDTAVRKSVPQGAADTADPGTARTPPSPRAAATETGRHKPRWQLPAARPPPDCSLPRQLAKPVSPSVHLQSSSCTFSADQGVSGLASESGLPSDSSRRRPLLSTTTS